MEVYAKQWRVKTNLHLLNIDVSSEETLMESLREKQTVTRMSRIVNQPRVFLSCFMIVHYPQMVLGHNVFDYYLRQKANRLVELFTSLKQQFKWIDYIAFQWKYHQFKEYFFKWKEQDKVKLCIPLAYEYWDLENLKESYTEERDIRSIRANQDMIWERIGRFFSDVQAFVDSYKERRPGLEEEVAESFYTRWMQDLHKDLLNQKYERIAPLLQDVINLIKECVPNNHKYVRDIEERLDTDYIASLIRHTSIDVNAVRALVLFVMEIIRELEAVDMDDDTDMATALLSDMFEQEFTYADIFCFFFQVVFKKLEIIRKRRLQFLDRQSNP